MSRFRVHIFLTVVSIILYLILIREQSQSDSTIAQLIAEPINQITLKQTQQYTINKDEHGHWYFHSPIYAPAHPERIALLLQFLSQPIEYVFAVNEVHDLSEFGFKDNSLILQLNHQHAITFGQRSPFDSQRYIQYQGALYVVKDTIYSLLDSHYVNLIDNRLLPYHAKIQSIKLPRYREKKIISEETVTLHHITETDNLITLWRSAVAHQVSIGQPPFQPDNAASVIVTFDNQKTVTLRIKKYQDHTVIFNPELNLRYRLPADFFQYTLPTEK